MARRKLSKCPPLIAAAAVGSVLFAVPAQAAPPAHVTGAAYGCYWRHVDGHWVWENGQRHWVPPRSVRVCG